MKKIFILLLSTISAFTIYSQPGEIDLTFNPGDLGFNHGDGPNDYVWVVTSQPDGKIIIGGSFSTYNGVPRNMIARLHADGTLDHTFDPGTGLGCSQGVCYIEAIQVLMNGKILVGGKFNLYNGQAVNNLIQLNADGSLDMDFNIGAGPNNIVSVIRQQNDGCILIGGRFTEYNGVSMNYLARLHSDGSLDDSFQGPAYGFNNWIHEILELSDDKILVGGDFAYAGETTNHYLIRLMSDGNIDTTFNTNFTPVQMGWGFETPFVRRIHVTDDNKYLVAGSLVIPGNDGRNCVIQLHSDGTLDEEFEIPLMTPFQTIYPGVSELFPLAQGQFLISGSFASINGIQYRSTAVLNNNGTLDTTFDLGELEAFSGIIQQGDGKILISSFAPINFNSYLLRLTEDFVVDPTFNPVTGANSRVQAIAREGSSKVYIGGHFHFYNGHKVKGVARLLHHGDPDPAFNPGHGINFGSQVFSLLPLPDGRLLVGGFFSSFDGFPYKHLVCLNSNGSVDTAFSAAQDPGGAVYKVEMDSDGKFLVAGAFTVFNGQTMRRIARLNTDGSLDETFSTGQGANNTILCLALQNDGKIIIGGNFGMFDGAAASRIARLNTNGSRDIDFNIGYGFQGNAAIYALGLQSSGKIIAAGTFSLFDSIAVNGIVRLNTNGSLDTTFAPGFGPQGAIDKMLIQSDDKIIIGGRFTMFDSIPVGYFARLNADGSLDTTFQTGTGFNNFVEAMALQEDGNILVGGWFTGYNGVGRNRITRIIGVEPDGVPKIRSQNNWIVFPNPTNSTIILKTESDVKVRAVNLYNIQGVVVKQFSGNFNNTINLDLSTFPPGVYIAEVLEDTQPVRVKVIRK